MNKTMTKLLIIFLIGQICAPSWSQEKDGLRIEGKKIILNDGYTFQTNIFNLNYIGQLKASKKRPFLILTGVQCDSCDESVSIYIVSPSDGPLKKEHE